VTGEAQPVSQTALTTAAAMTLRTAFGSGPVRINHAHR